MNPPDITVFIRGVSVLGPGLSGWTEAAPVLAGEREWVDQPVIPPPPLILPANERRRAGMPVRLALAVAGEAVRMSGLPPAAPRGVFASSNGDGLVLDSILTAMTTPGGMVSPTQFHNSVHNAVAANWTIGVGSTRPATSIGLHDETFAAGLLKAAAETVREGEPMLFCAYDAPLPPPLAVKRPTDFAFALALVLTATREAAGDGPVLARLSVRFASGAPGPESWLPVTPALRPRASGNPAARGLRLLEALARGTADSFALPYAGGRVEIGVTPTRFDAAL